jgi:AcrR family transcriptional regulator
VAALGINAIAERSGVDKTLLHRYYGGIEGLMAAYAAASDFWPCLDEILGEDRAVLSDPDHARAGARLLLNYSMALRRRPVTLSLLGRECLNRNPLTAALEDVREQRSRELFQALSDAGFPLQDEVAELASLLAVAMNYLAVRGRALTVFSGPRVHADEDWLALQSVLESALRGAILSSSGADRADPAPKRKRSRGKRPRPPSA